MSLVIVAVGHSFTAPMGARSQQGPAPSGDRLSIGTPKPTLSCPYRYEDSVVGSSEFTDRWDQFTKTGSRVVTTKTSSKGPGATSPCKARSLPTPPPGTLAIVAIRVEGAACWRADGTPIGVSGGLARPGIRFRPDANRQPG